MHRINVNLYPPDGRYFVERDGTRIKGGSWKEVVERVTAYRNRNGIPVGDVSTEIEEQFCKRSPALCGSTGPAPVPKPKKETPAESLKVRMLKWLSSMTKLQQQGGALKMVSPQEADKRARICSRCPANMDIPSGCSACKLALVSMRAQLVGNRPNPDSRVIGCSHLGVHLPTALWLDEVRVESAALPANCWRKASS